MAPMKATNRSSFSKGEIDVLAELLCQNADTVLSKLNLSLRKDFRKYSGCCPVHGGDNITALNLYHEGDGRQIGNWICNTHHCEKTFHPTFVGFVRGVLSERLGWRRPGDKTKDFIETLNWCLETLGKQRKDIVVDKVAIERNRFVSLANTISPQIKLPRNKWTKQEFLSRIDLNDKYFIHRGFSQEILHKYSVGISKTDDKLSIAYGRVLAPVFDEDHNYIIGAQGRTTSLQCGKCKLYHHHTLPCPTTALHYSKWVNIPERFEISRGFYNCWFAKKEILKANYAILVEGPPDIWKLEQAGYHTGLAVCGSSMSDAQQIFLESLGIQKIYTIFDNDEAGKACANSVFDKLKRQFKIADIEINNKDIGDMKVDEIKNLLGEHIKC